MEKSGSSSSLKSFAKRRLLSDMIGGSREAAKKKNKPCKEFILVIQKESLSIINSLLKMTDLTSNGVFGVERLDLARKPFPMFQAIYFINPTNEAFDQIAQDMEDGLYSHIHIFTVSEIPEEVMANLSSKKKMIRKLLSLKELNLDFRTVDDCTFTLEMFGILNYLYFEDHGYKSLICDRIAKKLFCALSIMMPTQSLEVTFQKTKTCSLVAGGVLDKFQAYLDNLAKSKAPEEDKDGPIKVLILERSYDVITPLMHDFYYQSLVGDLLEVGYDDTVSFITTDQQGKKTNQKAILDGDDQVWKEFRYKHMADALSGVNESFKSMIEQTAAAKLQKGEYDNIDINKMQEIVRGMPEYTLTLKKYTLHMSLLDRLMGNFSKKNLKEIGDLEQTISTGVDSDEYKPSSSKIFQKFFEVLKNNPELSDDLKLRLSLLLYCNLSLSDSSKTKVKGVLDSELDKRCLLNLNYLNVDLAAPSKATKNKLSDGHKAEAKKKMRSEKYDLCRYTVPLDRILDEYLEGRMDQTKFESQLMPKGAKQKNYLPNNLAAFRSHNVSKKKRTNRSKLVLFIIGGITYPEIRVLKTKGKR